MAQPLLRDAAAHHLEEQLTAFVQLPPDSPLREKMTKTAYGQLKQYLMLTRPEKMDAAWFATTLMQDWPQRSGIADASGRAAALRCWHFMPPAWNRIRSGVCLSMTVWSARCAHG
ncbi:probable membrane protein YPO1482 [Klebsiella pneumoniae IS39]|nr:probable membrane protein YPO1482 [Klebsiella pneumoniae IS39]